MEESLNAAESAFDGAEYSRALNLALPASEFGNLRALGLVEDVLLGQYVPFKNSD